MIRNSLVRCVVLAAAIALWLAWPALPPGELGAAFPLVPVLGLAALLGLGFALSGGKKKLEPGKIYALKVWTPTGKNPVTFQNQISGPGTRFGFDGAGRLPVLVVVRGKNDHFPNVPVDQWTVFVLNRAARELPFAPPGQDWFVEDAAEVTAATPAPLTDKLDANLSPEERAAVANALSAPLPTDPNARLFEASQLRAFADAMLPDHPLASAALRARADQLSPNAPPAPAPGVAPPGVPPVAPAVFVPPVPPAIIPIPTVPTAPAPGVRPPALQTNPQPPNQPPLPPPPPDGTTLGATAIVTTHDVGQAGALRVRSAPSTTAPAVPGGEPSTGGGVPHGATVNVTGPIVNGFSPIQFQSLRGFGWAGYLTPTSAAPGVAVVPTSPIAIPTTTITAPVPNATVRAPSGLNVRTAPSTSGTKIGAVPFGAGVVVVSHTPDGWAQISSPLAGFVADNTTVAPGGPWLTPIGSISAGYAAGHDELYAAGYAPSEPVDPKLALHKAAVTLDASLQTGQCRSRHERIVQIFQLAAKRSGALEGPPDGFYDERTATALAKVLGHPVAPACFNDQGGPTNPDSYWAPLGA